MYHASCNAMYLRLKIDLYNTTNRIVKYIFMISLFNNTTHILKLIKYSTVNFMENRTPLVLVKFYKLV